MINSTKKYHFNMGYNRLVIPGQAQIMTGAEARAIIQADITRARRYFGTAHATYTKIEKTIYIEVCARRDPNSALWGRWILKEY